MKPILILILAVLVSQDGAWALSQMNPDRVIDSYKGVHIERPLGGCLSGNCSHPEPIKVPKFLPMPIPGEAQIWQAKDFSSLPEASFPGPEVNYTVNLKTSAPGVLSCEAIGDKYKIYESSLQQIQALTSKMETGTALDPDELRNLEKLTAAIPELDQEIRPEVEISIQWQLKGWLFQSSQQNPLLQFFDIDDFKYLTARGPALQWMAEHSTQPEFVQTKSGSLLFIVAYRVPVLDFCFGESDFLMTTRESRPRPPIVIANLGIGLPVSLGAHWNRDLKESPQTGQWNIHSDTKPSQ